MVTGCCAGVVRGPVRLVLHPSDAGDLRGCILVALQDDDQIVGFGSFVAHPTRDDSWALLPNLYLHPAAIGEGHGSALMAAGLARLVAFGYQHVELWVHPDNQRARGFYERGGWVSDGTTQVEEVWGVELAELRMTKELTPDTEAQPTG